MKSLFSYLVVTCAMSIFCCASGCYSSIQHLVYNNTGETLEIIVGKTVHEIKARSARRIVIDSHGKAVLIRKGQEAWRYFVTAKPEGEMDFDKRIVRIQIEHDGSLYVLRPKTKFPVDVGAHPDCIIHILKPAETFTSTPLCYTLMQSDIVEHKRRALLSGDGEAAFGLHLHYQFGFTPDDILSAYWLHKSAELGYENAQYVFGDDYWLRKSKELGYKYKKARHVFVKNDFTYPNDNQVTYIVYFDQASRDVEKHRQKIFGNGDREAGDRLYLYYLAGCMMDDAQSIYWLHKTGYLGYAKLLYELNLTEAKLGTKAFENANEKTK